MNYNDRYSDDWKRGIIQPSIHNAVNHRCCYCLKCKSKEVHHVYYADARGKVKDRERSAGGDALFPVCLRCHNRILHSKKWWHYDSNDLVFGSHNDPVIVDRLRFGYELLSKGTL